MTNKEALIAVLAFTPDEGALDKALLDSGLNPDGQYSPGAGTESIGLAEIELLFGMLMVTSEKEGSWSVTYSREGLLARLLYLAKKYGRDDIIEALGPKMIIRDKSNMW